jgi:hypothetical protein
MNKYRKLVAAAVGLVAIVLGPAVLGVTPGEDLFGIGQDKVVQLVLAVGTAIGVWGVRNDEA